jgi:hypothetical protein
MASNTSKCSPRVREHIQHHVTGSQQRSHQERSHMDKTGAKVIVDAILAYGTTIPILLSSPIFNASSQHSSTTVRATLKLKKCKWFHSHFCCVRVDVCTAKPTSQLKTSTQHSGQSNNRTHLQTSECLLECLVSTPSGYSATRSEHCQWTLKQQLAPG